MRRYCDINEISDGNCYSENDMVKLSCNGCNGAASCCHGMGTSIILDPYDVYRLTKELSCTMEQLLVEQLELNVVDGMILPNMKMVGKEEACFFLDKAGACSIHESRPGFCRIFPLGRYYKEDDFTYILQASACKNQHPIKTKVGKWIDTKDWKENRVFIRKWHNLLHQVEYLVTNKLSEEEIKQVNLFLLRLFYFLPYDNEQSFYEQFDSRLNQANEILQ
ncbi:MAG: uncharacterized protein PWP24_734 [Clostridiales bacterium]|nr:uncharacterized protein [Clostridiales bacterium]